MKRYMTWVRVLLLAGMLVSCGGGGDSTSGGGSPGTTNGGNPGNTSGGNPGDNSGGNPGNDSGGGTLPSAGARVEESDAAAVSLSAGWTQADPLYGWSGGSAMQSTTAGATVSFTFTGTSVRWIGALNRDGGIALVRVDGGQTKGVDLFEMDLFTRPREARTPVITLYDLVPGQHTLTIEVTGRKNPDANSNVVVVDAFDVEPQIVSHLQERDPDVTFSPGWADADERFHWSGCCVRTLPDPPIGGAVVTETPGGNVTLKFRGTSINWMGYRGPDAGIASVKVDGGEPTEVDLYSPNNKIQEIVFSKTGLADATHTLTIQATGRKNDASTGAKIVVDAFDVTTPGRRYQEWPDQVKDRAKFTYTGTWEGRLSRVWSEGFALVSPHVGASVTFSFTGTSVSWIGCQKSSCGGRAKIFIDGAFEKEVNNRKPVPIEGFQHTIFRKDGLTDGPHTLRIEVTSDGPYVVVDAFDVHPPSDATGVAPSN
jgi:hypothetical protein